MRKQKTNNEGFSLLEIIISIAMIGIVFVSLMQYFSSSIKANNYAKTVQKASLAAQTVMEELQGFSTIKDIGTRSTWVELKSDYTRKDPVTDFSSTPLPSTYYFKRDISIDNTVYDALITIDTSPYNSVPPVSPGAPAPPKYNTLEIAQVQDINSDANAILVELNQNTLAIDAFVAQDITYCSTYSRPGPRPTTLPRTTIESNMTRELCINITPSGVGQIRFKAFYKYNCSTSPARFSEVQIPVLDVYMDEAQFKSFYYFYNKFKSTEKITISDSGIDAYNAHIVCQDADTSLQANIINGNISKINSNVSVRKGALTNNERKLVDVDDKKQRYADVTVQIFEQGQTMTSANVLAEIKTTRGE